MIAEEDCNSDLNSLCAGVDKECTEKTQSHGEINMVSIFKKYHTTYWCYPDGSCAREKFYLMAG